MIRLFALIFTLFVANAGIAQEVQTAPGAVLRGLDRVSGETTDLEIKKGATVNYGKLEITLSDCRYPVGNPTGDAFAHLTIRDILDSNVDFDGWMIASSPALNALDHPRYDVWVIRCITSKG